MDPKFHKPRKPWLLEFKFNGKVCRTEKFKTQAEAESAKAEYEAMYPKGPVTCSVSYLYGYVTGLNLPF